MKKRIHKSIPDFVAVPDYVVKNENLSLEAIGLATLIYYLDMRECDYASASLRVWKLVVDGNCYDAYKELVREEIINDVIGGWRDEH